MAKILTFMVVVIGNPAWLVRNPPVQTFLCRTKSARAVSATI